jgi:uncharacterized protein (TIGR03085 family)
MSVIYTCDIVSTATPGDRGVNRHTIPRVTDYARRERRRLADLLLETGPDVPTLCAGWTTRDLAAHLVVRERRPDAPVTRLIPPLAAHAEHVRQQMAARPYAEVVALVRTPPWWSPLSNPLTDELFNGLEFFIHHEDVRRGRPGWEPRTLDPGHQAALWRAVGFTARLGLRRLHIPVLVRAPGFGELVVAGERPQATLTGEPGELALFVSGRQRAARVDVDGPHDTTERLRTAALGL